MPVSLSSSVLPELREYERTITTVANGYVQPQVARYVSNLAGQLRTAGVQRHAVDPAQRRRPGLPRSRRRQPGVLLLSGPAGGVTGAAWAAEQAGFRDFLTFDMGGTSTDVALVQDLQAAHRPRDDGGRPEGPRHLGRRAHGRAPAAARSPTCRS